MPGSPTSRTARQAARRPRASQAACSVASSSVATDERRLVVAAQRARQRHLRRRRGDAHGRRGEVQGGVLAQDRRLQAHELGRRPQPELGVQQRGARPERLERLALAAAAVEGEHQLPRGRSRSGSAADERAQLPDDLRVAAEEQAPASKRSSSAARRSSSRRAACAWANGS